MIPKVAASEMGDSLNLLHVIDCNRCVKGVVGLFRVICRLFKKLQNFLLDEFSWKAGP